MVFFTCNGCGSCLKKNQVDKHRYQCRQSHHLSCMDCSKDFYGEDYQSHIKCISEEEKYSAKGWEPKAGQNKNEKRQQEWVSLVQSVIQSQTSLPADLRSLLNTISQYENIPRKKPKFLNFLKNIQKNRLNPPLAEKAWNLISSALEAQKAAQASNPAPKPEANPPAAPENGVTNETEEKDKKKSKRERKEERSEQRTKKEKKDKENSLEEESTKPKKRKKGAEEDETPTNGHAEDVERPKAKKRAREADQNECESIPEVTNDKKPKLAETESQEEEEKGAKFKWSTIAKILLSAEDDKELSLKKIKKKAVAEYLARMGESDNADPDQIWAKGLKKLSKNPKFKIHKDRIKLVA